MGLCKSTEEKNADRALAAARKAEAKERAERAKYRASPVGRAESARNRGDQLLQVSMEIDDDGGQLLSSIEAMGWRLEHAGYSHQLEIMSMNNMTDQLSSLSSSTKLMGVYVFRKA